MKFILRFFAIFIITTKRMFAQRGLVLATTLGIISAVALSMSIPIYSDGVYQTILESAEGPASSDSATFRPPFAFLYRYVGEWSGPITFDKLAPIDAYLSGPVVSDLAMKSKLFVRFFRTDNFKLFPADTGSYDSTAEPLTYANFATVNDLEKHITLVEGAFPAAEAASNGGPIDILLSDETAAKLGLHTGELYDAFIARGAGVSKKVITQRVRIAGIWKPIDPNDIYWFYSSTGFDTTMFVPEKTFINVVLPILDNDVNHAVWYYVMDGTKVQSSDVPSMLGRIASTRQKAINLLNGLRLDLSPEEILQQYQKSAQSLTIYLYAFSLPLLFMILTFISLVVDMVVGRRRNEIAVLRSRGSTILQVLGMGALESLILGVGGMIFGTPAAQVVAQFFGKTKSFLDFTAATDMHTQITLSAVRFGLVTVAVALVAQVIPTLSASRYTIISYKQDRARQIRPPWWRRVGLDFLLCIPAGYGIYLLNQDLPLVPGGKPALSGSPFQNPLLLLVPALAIFAVTLLLLRVLPLLMRVVAWFFSHTRSVGMLMAARYLARTSSGYSAPLILLIMTLSLSTFTSTLAQTLDRHTHDQTYYSVGADMNVVELGELQGGSAAPPGGAAPQAASSSSSSAGDTTTPPEKWVFLPVSEHLKIPGVQAAARVAVTGVRITTPDGEVKGIYDGIDRIDFPKVAFWRRDFAYQQLGDLMNDLARTSEGVLVSTDILSNYHLKIGDALTISAYQFDETKVMTFKIMGAFNYFPGWYPQQDGPLIVGNLDYFYESVGGEFPYDVWLKVNPAAPIQPLLDGIQKLYGVMLRSDVSSTILTAAQLAPERQGFFGLLSVGFVALAFLTVLGFLLYALFSFQRRFIELGMLRAIGLSSGQMLAFLASELAFLFMAGLAAGTGLGVWVSNLFIPHLQVGNDMASLVPPFVVHIDWGSVFQVYILFGSLFVAALVVLGIMLMRMKIFQAIKLGESV
jgi:putative ABC transport system permease protein